LIPVGPGPEDILASYLFLPWECSGLAWERTGPGHAGRPDPSLL